MAERETKIPLLRLVRLFQGFSDEELHQIDAILKERRYKKGSIVFEQGDEGDSLYIVESGRLKASIRDEAGHEKILAVFGEGDYFGEMALLTEQQRTATLTVVGDAELLYLPKDEFERFLASNTKAMQVLLSTMTRRVTEANVIAQRNQPEDEAMVLGKVIVVFSPKGGTGKTTLAVNLATVLRQEANKSVVLVDASYPFGDVGIMMNMEPRRTISDLLPHINELDGEIIDSVLQTHPSGVKVLLAPPSPEETELVQAEYITIVLTALRELFEYIIVDVHSAFSEISIAALDAADLVLALTTMEMSAIKNTRLFMETVTTKLGYPIEKLALVVNRASPVGGLTIENVEGSVGHKVDATITSSGAIAVAAANQGVPFVISNKESQIYRDVVTLAKLIAPQTMEERDTIFDEEWDTEEVLTLQQRIKTMPKVLVSSVRESMAHIDLSDVLFGLGNLLLATVPFLLIVAILGSIARMLNVQFPTGAAYNISIWVGIVGGTFLIARIQPRERHGWVLGAILGALFGFFILLPTLAVLNITSGELDTPIFGLIFNIIIYGLLGALGSFLGEKSKRQAKALLVE